MCSLATQDLSVSIFEQPILNHCDLTIPQGTFHALMGQNGAGKSTLMKAIIGHPDYKITQGTITFDATDITQLAPEQRARMGIFLAYQNPVDIPGVTVANFIRSALNAQGKSIPTREYYQKLYDAMDLVGLDHSFSSRSINVGFSGGEKKRCEVLQMLMLEPKFILLDEIDSGLDIDAIKRIARCIHSLRDKGCSGIIISHYKHFLDLLEPETIHIMEHGQITRSGGVDLIDQLEQKGYALFEEA